MSSKSIWVSLALGLAFPILISGDVLAHGKNDLNRNHPGRTEARTGNFRRAAILQATGADENAWVRPLARAIAFSSKDQRPILSRIDAYHKKGQEISLVALNNGTGEVKVVAIPKDKTKPVRVMSNSEVKKLGLAPQSSVVPGLLSRVKSAKLGRTPAKDIRKASLSTSGLSYQGRAKTIGNFTPTYRPLEPGEHAVKETYISLPVTASKHNLSGAYITGWVISEK
jgi:hypothetical protein